jgi:hypothetical protein
VAAFLKLSDDSNFVPIVFPSSQFASSSYRDKAMLTVSSLTMRDPGRAAGNPAKLRTYYDGCRLK